MFPLVRLQAHDPQQHLIIPHRHIKYEEYELIIARESRVRHQLIRIRTIKKCMHKKRIQNKTYGTLWIPKNYDVARQETTTNVRGQGRRRH